MKNKKFMLAGKILILMFTMLEFSCSTGFTGNRIKNPDAYILEIEKMNGKDQHTIELMAGDVFIVHSTIEKGSLNLKIKGPDEKIIYAGNEKNPVNEFKVNISESGKYTIEVEAHHAKGKITVMTKKR